MFSVLKGTIMVDQVITLKTSGTMECRALASTARVMSKFQILAIDGDGMRGLFPVGILARFEETYGIAVVDCFDLIVGTYTGGIIALGLGKGLSLAEIEAFCLQRGPRIFAGADSVLRSIAHVGEAKYDTVVS